MAEREFSSAGELERVSGDSWPKGIDPLVELTEGILQNQNQGFWISWQIWVSPTFHTLRSLAAEVWSLTWKEPLIRWIWWLVEGKEINRRSDWLRSRRGQSYENCKMDGGIKEEGGPTEGGWRDVVINRNETKTTSEAGSASQCEPSKRVESRLSQTHRRENFMRIAPRNQGCQKSPGFHFYH